MRIALLADIHANLEALQACLAHAESQGADRFAFLGDFLGYGADPVAVVDLIEAHARKGAIVVLGNHDSAVLHEPSLSMHEDARAAIAWTQFRLRREQIHFLESLPLVHAEQDMLFVHASAVDPDKWIYVSDSMRAERCLDATKASYVFAGHVHEPVLYFTGAAGRPLPFSPEPGTPIPVAAHRRWLVIPGSVGQPRDGNPAACYALFDPLESRLTYHRIAYDYELTAAKIRAAHLPGALATRLESGY